MGVNFAISSFSNALNAVLQACYMKFNSIIVKYIKYLDWCMDNG